MSVELQNIDCNCNNCKFMIRDMVRFEKSLALHEKWQRDYYEIIKRKLPEHERENYRFQFNRSEVSINYGNCTNLNKPVSFIPNICQPDTQHCFENRKNVTG